MELFRLLGKISIDNTDAKRALDETTSKAKSTGSGTSGERRHPGNHHRAGAVADGFPAAYRAAGRDAGFWGAGG